MKNFVFVLLLCAGLFAAPCVKADGKAYLPNIMVHYDFPSTGEYTYNMFKITNISNVTVEVDVTFYNPDGVTYYEDSNNWLSETYGVSTYVENTTGPTCSVTIQPGDMAGIVLYTKHGVVGYGKIEWEEASGEPNVSEALIASMRWGTEQNGTMSWALEPVNGGMPF